MTNSIRELMHLFLLAQQGSPLAEKLLFPGEQAWLAGSLMQNAALLVEGIEDEDERFEAAVNKLSSAVLARIAFCERCLQTAVVLGAKQYVILGAGFDFAPHRDGNWRRTMETFLVDTPQMLSERAERFTECGESLRKFIYTVGAELPNSAAALAASEHFDPAKLTFCSLLDQADSLSIKDLEALIASLSPIMALGSCIVMDYSAFAPDAVEALFDRCGFMTYEHLDQGEMQHQFFGAESEKDPARRLSAPDGVRYILAVKR